MTEHKCSVCGKTLAKINFQQQKGMCRKDFTESEIERWLDNTDIFTDDTKGIVAWAKECLPKFTTNKIPDIHKQLYYEMLSLLAPFYVNKYERNLVEISFRGSAKSTAANMIFSSYLLAHNGRKFKIKLEVPTWDKEFNVTYETQVVECLIDEKFIVIISETATQAEDFVVTIRDEFSENERLKYFYKVKIEDAIESDTGQWTRKAFRFNGCYVMGKGTGQQIRGALKGASRPTYVILDDLYSEKSVTTPESRSKIRTWFYNAMYNSIDDLKGKCVLLGTILHEDTVLCDCMNNDQWKTVVNYPMPVELFAKFIAENLKPDYDISRCGLPFDDIENKIMKSKLRIEHFRDIQNSMDWQLAWPDRVNLYYLALKFKMAVETNSVSGFYQEFFHITISPDAKKFKREMFRHAKVEFEFAEGYPWIKINDGSWQICNVEMGVDTSAGTVKGDNTVITIAAVTESFRIYLLNQIVGKFSIRDNIKDGYDKLDKICTDRSYIERIGFVDELFRQALIYHPSVIKIGVAGEEKLNVDEIRRVFRVNEMYTVQIMERKQSSSEDNKLKRIISNIIGYYESLQVYHCFAAAELEQELEFLGKAKNDDRADSEEVSLWQIKKPYTKAVRNFDNPKKNEQIISQKKAKELFLRKYKKVSTLTLRDM